MFSLVGVLAFAAVASAHNWCNAPSRASLSTFLCSTVAPSLPASQDEPHAVVRAGQKFQFEWVTGHNADSYIILLAKKDSAKLSQHTIANFELFLKDAACPQNPPPPEWAAYHYKYNDSTTTFFANKDQNGVLPAPVPNFYQRRVPSSDPNFIPRSPAFRKGIKGINTRVLDAAGRAALFFQFEYKAADQATNRRCYPANPIAKFPWIIGMHKYRHVRHQPSEPDVTWLRFPPGTPAGDYIVQWNWRSYWDIMDVRVVDSATDIANPFGGGGAAGAPQTKYKRVDHCTLPGATLAGTCVKMTAPANGRLDPPTACLDACKAMNISKCDAVMVVPLVNPDSVAPAFKDIINIPFRAGTCVKPTDASTHMCYPVLEAEPQETKNSFRVTADTEDPAYYTTCFRRSDLVKRDGLPDPTSLPYISADTPAWKASEKCVSCAQQTLYTPATWTPVWEVASSCVNCDIDK